LVQQTGADAVAVLGITRGYTTRHGEGPLPTYSTELTARLGDPGNPWNRWQGSLRCGWLDLPLLRYAADVAGPLDGIVVNHLDQIQDGDGLVCTAYRNRELSACDAPCLTWQSRLTQSLQHADPELSPADPDRILGLLEPIAPVVLRGYGPTHEERGFGRLPFRRRRDWPGGVAEAPDAAAIAGATSSASTGKPTAGPSGLSGEGLMPTGAGGEVFPCGQPPRIG
jgi:adenylosuccinate synthase